MQIENIGPSTLAHRNLLNLIRQIQPVSGAELARRTDSQRSTIKYMLTILEQEGYITPSKIEHSPVGRGRPPILFELDPSKGWSIGLEILPAETRIFCCDFANKPIYKEILPLDNKSLLKSEDCTIYMKKILNHLSDQGLNMDQCLGLAVGLPAAVEQGNKKIQYSSPLDLSNWTLAMPKTFKRPCYLMNDANAGALGVYWFGSKERNVIYLSLNESYHGFGAGFVLNGQIYQGSQGFAGEFMEALPDWSQEVDDFKTLNINGSIPLTDQMEELLQRDERGDMAVKELFDKVAEFLSDTVVDLSGLINPDKIILGGDYTSFEPLLEKYLIPEIGKAWQLRCNGRIPMSDVEFSAFGRYSVAAGAAARPLYDFFLQD